MIILLLLILTFHLTNIAAIECATYNITKTIENDNLTIDFSSNNFLKLNQKVRCTSKSSLEPVNGCIHHCIELGYGQKDEISIEMEHDNGTTETCFMNYTIDLQPPSLAYLNITDDKVRLGINRPKDSFDYVKVYCSDNETHIIFNNSIQSNNSLATVDCLFISSVSLMSFMLETIKKGFHPVVNHISREIPLPIIFTHSFNSRLLIIKADPPPAMTINHTYEFQLIFHDKNKTYERMKISNFNINSNSIFNYGIIPNLKHEIIFKHIVDSIGYAKSTNTTLLISNISYPFQIKNLHIKEEFNNIILNWNDTHDLYDPIEFIVFCNSSKNSMKNVGRNTTYICEQMTFNETNSISVQTRVAILGYTHDRTADVHINVSQIPEIPVFKVFNKTETSITIRWNSTNNSLIKNLFKYKINCGLNDNSIEIDIQSNEYQCQSLVQGTLYVIKMFIENINNTIQRSKSIQENTLLEKCQYKNHFYSPDFNGTRSVIIEWNTPDKNFDKIYVHCPSSNTTFNYSQIMLIMLVKCIVKSGVQFTVTFNTLKSGYEWRTLEFTDTPPIYLTTTTTSESTLSTTTSACPLNRELEWRIAAVVAFIIAGFLILVIILSVVFYLRNRNN